MAQVEAATDFAIANLCYDWTDCAARFSLQSICARASLFTSLMPLPKVPPRVLGTLRRDGWLLFTARSARMFAYGSLAVVLVLYLRAVGVAENQRGALLTFTLLGDTAIS